MICHAVAARIKELCKQRGITINKLATISGVTQSTIDNIVKGNSKNPGIATIKMLCDGLSLPIIEFFNCETFTHLEQEIK